MFGEFLGLWCVQVWHDQGKPARKRLVELGPGRGTLMADVLRAARLAPEFLEGLEIVLVEASPKLRAMQEEKLKGHAARWTDRFDSTLGDRPLFLLANEFFDALPIHQYVKTSGGWRERMVTVADGKLDFALSPLPAPDSLIPLNRSGAPDGAVFEICQPALSLTDEIARIIAVQGGGALIVDYGYDNVDFGETLQAINDQSFAAILDDPGGSDLSAHVDFLSLAATARNRRRGDLRPYRPRRVPRRSRHRAPLRAALVAQPERGPRPPASTRPPCEPGPDGYAVQGARHPAARRAEPAGVW